MEGVGARLGRSSTRYGPATVFTGPVRKWKKKWVHVSPSNNKDNNNHSQNLHSNTNGISNSANGSRLLLYKWTPVTPSQNSNNANNGEKNSVDEAAAAAVSPAPEEPPRRKFKYVPIAVIEEQNMEAEENDAVEIVDNEAKQSEADPGVVEPTPNSNGYDEKPDINDVPMEQHQSQEDKRRVQHDLNESTLDLSLGLTAHDSDSDLKTVQNKGEHLERDMRKAGK